MCTPLSPEGRHFVAAWSGSPPPALLVGLVGEDMFHVRQPRPLAASATLRLAQALLPAAGHRVPHVTATTAREGGTASRAG